MKILVVDDEQLVRWFLERALKRWGHNVVSTATKDDALALMHDIDFDMLVTDLRMPAGNGAELIEKVSILAKKPRIIVCSAYITNEMATDFHLQGICTLKKPFKLDELEKILADCSPN